MRALLALFFLVTAARAQVIPAGTSDTFFAVPQANASFLPDLQTFLRGEDAARFNEQFQSFVVSGCIGPTSVTLSHTPTTCLAYPGGYRTTETGHILYVDNSTCWTIVTSGVSGDVTGPGPVTFTRVPSTHYAINCTDPNQPAVPPNAALTMKVTTAAGAITAVADIRVLSPVSLVTAGNQGVGNAVPDCLDPNKICGTLPLSKLVTLGYRAQPITPSLNFSTVETSISPTLSLTTVGGRVHIEASPLTVTLSPPVVGSITYRWYEDNVLLATQIVSFQNISATSILMATPISPYIRSGATNATHVYKVTAQSSSTAIVLTTDPSMPGFVFASEQP